MDRNSAVPADSITPQRVYEKRRAFMKGGAGALVAACALLSPKARALSRSGEQLGRNLDAADDWLAEKIAGAPSSQVYTTAEAIAPQQEALRFNNFYEFGSKKGDPARYGKDFQPLPWSVGFSGLKGKDISLTLQDILAGADLEERILRLRCVEAWSMVLPWVVFPLHQLIDMVAPSPKARFVRFQTVYRPEQMRDQNAVFPIIDYPYVEGLRMDEAMHPLTCMAVGLYRQPLKPQSGAPMRLLVPWKYGFKSIKSIDRIDFVESRPVSTWEAAWPQAYGFYANVNPNVDHPGWSQASERRLPSTTFRARRIRTTLWNGYDEVAGLYQGLDLVRNY